MKKQKWVLILDDLRTAFDLQKLGVPDQGCKLIITTRSYKVCQEMKTQHIITVQPISKEDAWDLFIEKLGHDIILSPEVKQIALDIVSKCDGFPLRILIMAAFMRGVDEPHRWRITLKSLKKSKFRDTDDGVSQLFRFGYDRLDNSALQKCLLHCALFPEGQVIERNELIGELINEGIIETMLSRQEAFDKGHTMLNKLEDFGLLERIGGGSAVKMHDLIRDMAIRIRKENPSVMDKMVRSNDTFGNHVEDMNGAAGAAIDGPPGRKRNTVAGSRNNDPTIGNDVHTNDIENGTGGVAEKQQDAGESSRPGDKMVRSNDTFGNHVEDMNGAAGAAIDGPPGRKRNTVAGSRNNEPTIGNDVHTNDIENGTGGVADKQQDAGESSRPGEKSGWALLMTNLILEFASAVFDQLGYALIGMVLAFVALLLATAELVHMARKERMDLLPISHRSSTSPSAPGKPAGTIVEYFGLVGAVWQCFYSTVEYAFARQKKDNPIKMCLLPFLFLLCVVFFKLIKKSFR
ncbi:hypothetical protein NC652_040452 [Populus alba x Populus x berolinensis]|nr:hypothetical protein NC652_040452 [Populus alba x Populus x berolinensis]